MKEHASVGADILSSINFPYPVVPIVRHHHENWDGTGYPDGLRGIEIPVGARILAVVDCFDALTSDRPYRPKMSDSDAIAILLQRRGTMYDPLVVDTFVANLKTLTAEIDVQAAAEAPATSRRLLVKPQAPVAADAVAATQLDSELDRAIQRTGANVGIVFIIDREADRLVSTIARTDSSSVANPVSMPLGYGVSGWVATNGTPILNADAALDFQCEPPRKGLVRAISVPIRNASGTVGVLSLYTDDPRGFNEEDRSWLEQLAASLENTSIGAISDGMLPLRQPGSDVPARVH
jgi:hypothetical protein